MNYSQLCLGCMAPKTEEETCPHCGRRHDAEPESLLHLPPGTVLEEKYLIGRVLGQGGFGITYLAYDLKLKIKLAVKEFFPQGLVSRITGTSQVTVYSGDLQEQFNYGVERFIGEAQTLARFAEHPNIVTVRDFFEANGTAYMVTAYVEGLTLEEYLEENGGSIPFQTALDVMMPVMDALREVHSAGFMHRDISPDNIFIDVNGRIILIDFGAARQDLKEKSKSLSVVIKAGYAPEEQYRSRGKQGPWTDVYAVAATIYRAITGKIPLESLDRSAGDELVLPSELGAYIPAPTEQVLQKAMAVWAAERYQDMNSFQQALQQATAAPEAPASYHQAAGTNNKQQTGPSPPSFSTHEDGIAAGEDVPPGLPLYPEQKAGPGSPAGINDKQFHSRYNIAPDSGSIPLGELEIGDRVVDSSWQWEFKIRKNYTGKGVIRPVTWIVVAKDHYEGLSSHVTLLAENLIGFFTFDDSKHITKYGSNHWGDSGAHATATRGLRPWLNSTGIHSKEGFYRAFSGDFQAAVLRTPVPNREWKAGSLYITEDKVFIPSTTELGDKKHDWTYSIGAVFSCFNKASGSKRQAEILGDGIEWYWTRSPHVNSADSVRCVYSSGHLGDLARDAHCGARPALNLPPEIPISGTPNNDGVYEIAW